MNTIVYLKTENRNASRVRVIACPELDPIPLVLSHRQQSPAVTSVTHRPRERCVGGEGERREMRRGERHENNVFGGGWGRCFGGNGKGKKYGWEMGGGLL